MMSRVPHGMYQSQKYPICTYVCMQIYPRYRKAIHKVYIYVLYASSESKYEENIWNVYKGTLLYGVKY